MNIIIKIVIATVILLIVASAYICLHNDNADEPIFNKLKGNENNNTGNIGNAEEKLGFEAVFAIAGLLAIGYLVLRQRE